MADTRTLVTIARPVDAGGVHTNSLMVAAGRPVLEAIRQTTFHLEAVLDVLFPIALNAKINDESVYPAISSAAIAKALAESVMEAIELADMEAERASDPA